MYFLGDYRKGFSRDHRFHMQRFRQDGAAVLPYYLCKICSKLNPDEQFVERQRGVKVGACMWISMPRISFKFCFGFCSCSALTSPCSVSPSYYAHGIEQLSITPEIFT